MYGGGIGSDRPRLAISKLFPPARVHRERERIYERCDVYLNVRRNSRGAVRAGTIPAEYSEQTFILRYKANVYVYQYRESRSHNFVAKFCKSYLDCYLGLCNVLHDSNNFSLSPKLQLCRYAGYSSSRCKAYNVTHLRARAPLLPAIRTWAKLAKARLSIHVHFVAALGNRLRASGLHLAARNTSRFRKAEHRKGEREKEKEKREGG